MKEKFRKLFEDLNEFDDSTILYVTNTLIERCRYQKREFKELVAALDSFRETLTHLKQYNKLHIWHRLLHYCEYIMENKDE